MTRSEITNIVEEACQKLVKELKADGKGNARVDRDIPNALARKLLRLGKLNNQLGYYGEEQWQRHAYHAMEHMGQHPYVSKSGEVIPTTLPDLDEALLCLNESLKSLEADFQFTEADLPSLEKWQAANDRIIARDSRLQ